ncbi:unnamed protein product, partial [Closterium sp. NIES-54]
FPDATEIPRWSDLLRSGVAIFDLDFDAILAAMYAVSISAEGDSYVCVPPDPGIEAAALGASESAALGAGEPALLGTESAQVFHTFTLDSGASCSFFRDLTTLTPLTRPVAVSLADPSGGPVLARYSTVLPSVVAVVLERQMAALRIEEDEAVEEVVQKFFDLLTRLEGADLNYSELQKKTKLLALLPESWSSLIINLNRDLPHLSLEDVKRAILQEDFRRRELASADGAGAESIGRGYGRGKGRGRGGGRFGGSNFNGGRGSSGYGNDNKNSQEGRGAGGGRGRDRGGRGGRGGGAASMKSAGNESDSRDDRFPSQFFFVSTQAPAGPEKDEGFEEPAAVGKVTLHSLDYWVIDSGATYSMTPRADLLTELEPSPVNHVTSALGQRAEVKGMGKAMFKGADGKMVGLKNKKCNLGGTSKLGKHKESGAAAQKQHKGEENPKAAAEEEYGENMWGTIASAAFSNPTSATGECDWLTLHRRMGHVALPILQQLVKNEMVAGIRVKGEPDEVLGCPTCMEAKFTRYLFSSSEATAKAPLDEVVMDVVGPLKLGAAGAEYFLTIVDVYTRMTWVYVLSKKSDVAETVKTDWLPMVERQQDRLVKALPYHAILPCNERHRRASEPDNHGDGARVAH